LILLGLFLTEVGNGVTLILLLRLRLRDIIISIAGVLFLIEAIGSASCLGGNKLIG
jgi:hypothetical protein